MYCFVRLRRRWIIQNWYERENRWKRKVSLEIPVVKKDSETSAIINASPLNAGSRFRLRVGRAYTTQELAANIIGVRYRPALHRGRAAQFGGERRHARRQTFPLARGLPQLRAASHSANNEWLAAKCDPRLTWKLPRSASGLLVYRKNQVFRFILPINERLLSRYL